MKSQYCYGCIHLTRRFMGDGTTIYGCALVPGLVKGAVGAFEDDLPLACEQFTREQSGDEQPPAPHHKDD